MNPILDGILTLEGDYVNLPKDRGGETHWGITEATARANDYVGDMKELTRAEAYTILENMYWIKPGFEKISRISWAVSFELCDAAVNIGPPLSLYLATALAERFQPRTAFLSGY